MTDRTVKVKLQADVKNYVTNMGKAVAATKALDLAAKRASASIDKLGKAGGFETVSKKATTASEKVSKVGEAAQASSAKVRASSATATAATDKLTESFTKAGQSAKASGDKAKTSAEATASATEKATEATAKSEKATTSAGKSVTVASKNADNYASALGRLRVAQLRLTEAQNRKGSAGTSGLAGAEESVASAERAVKKFEKAGNDSGKSFTTGLRKWLTGNGGAGDAGKAGGTVFGSGFLGVLKTPILGPAVIAILSAVFVAVMPAVGALAAGALITAFGAGLVGLGLVFAAQADGIGGKWSKMLSRMGNDLSLLSRPFVATLSHISDYFQQTFDKFNPVLGKAFADLAGPVDKFVERATQGLQKLIPAIGPITDAFAGVLDSLGGALPGAIETMASGFTRLALSVQQNPTALADTVSGLATLVAQITDFISTLNNINGQFERLTGGVSLVEVTFAALGGIIYPLTATFSALSKGLDLVNAALHETGSGSDTAGASMSSAAAKTADLAGRVNGLAGAAQHGAPALGTLAEQAAAAKQKIADAKAATQTWISSLFELQGLALSLSGAQISFQAAIDGVTASIKENGRSHDINTAKGRANRTALDEVANSANAQTQAMLDNKKGVRAASDSAAAARATYIALAEKLHYTKEQATAMADKFLTIPKKTQTDFKADIHDLDSKLASARKQLKDPHLTATKKAKLQAEIKQLLAAKAQAQRSIDSLTGKTVALTVNTYKNLIETTTHNDVGVRAPGHADGGKLGGSSPNKKADNMLFWGTAGEWVQPNDSVDYYGPGFMQAVQKKQFPKSAAQGYANGGQLGHYADGGFLPGGKLVDIAFLLKQLGIPFNPSAGVNYGSTLKAQNAANAAAAPAKAAAGRADQAEVAAKATVARIQRAITLQQRYVAELRREGASKKKIAAESKETIGLQDQLYRAKQKVTAATAASSKADAAYKVKSDAATAAIEAHKAAVQKLIEQQQAAVDMAASISDSLTSGANIGDLFQDSLTGKGLLADLQAQGTKTGMFGGQVSKLRKQGLSEDLIQQIIGKGAEQGGEVAQAILDGGQGLVNALNKAQKNLDDQANLIGAGSANKKYGQAISGARADGGDVMAGKTYRVNERGEELFQPKVSGRIIPHQYVGGFGAGGTSRSETHYHLKQEFTGVSMAEADLIGRRALGALRLAGRR